MMCPLLPSVMLRMCCPSLPADHAQPAAGPGREQRRCHAALGLPPGLRAQHPAGRTNLQAQEGRTGAQGRQPALVRWVHPVLLWKSLGRMRGGEETCVLPEHLRETVWRKNGNRIAHAFGLVCICSTPGLIRCPEDRSQIRPKLRF